MFDDVAFGPLNLGLSADEVKRSRARLACGGGHGAARETLAASPVLGEKRRISIATVLAMSPRMLVMDEPTSNLDPGGKWNLIELLRALPGTKLVVSHDLEMVEALCPRVVIMDGGLIVADGPREVILRDKQLLAAHSLAAPGGFAGCGRRLIWTNPPLLF